jgi:5-formyltetrahydrofolate cyclo-ligase
MEIPMEDKSVLRKRMLKLRDSLSTEKRVKWSLEIGEKIRSSEEYKTAKIIFSYASFSSEVSTETLNQWVLEDGKALYLPKTYVKKHEMEFYHVTDLAQLEHGYQGILEPKESLAARWTPTEEIPESLLMLMPGVAFDERGNRIGYGGGYYDRYLEKYGAYIGKKEMLAFLCQKTGIIPAEESDISPDYIITDMGD